MPRYLLDEGHDHASVPHVVVVDPNIEHYKPLAASARLGKIDIHFRASGAEALKLARRQRVDAWLVAEELDDMAGQDFVELLRSKMVKTAANEFAPPARVAMVDEPGEDEESRRGAREREAVTSGADGLVSKPITFRDLEDLLGVAAVDRTVPFDAPPSKRAFVTLPVGVGAAIVAIAVLMMS